MKSKEQRIFLFSKTSYPDINYIPILHIDYLQPEIVFSSYDYIIATSKEVFKALDKIGEWRALPVLAISEATERSAREAGAKILDVSDGYGENIVALIQEKYTELNALYPHAEVVAFDIAHHLQESGIKFGSFSVYKTACATSKVIDLPSDAICVFTSPSAVRCFETLYGFLPSYKAVCIGETTRSALPKGIESVVSESTSIQSAVARAQMLLQ